MKRHLVILSVLTLAACATPAGPLYKPEPIKKGQAKLVVYRPKGSILLSGRGAPSIKINGIERCNIDDGRYFSVDIPSGTTTLSTRLIGDIYTSQYALPARAGSTIYVKVLFNEPSVYGQIAAGVIASSALTQEGTFLFREGNASEAGLTYATCQ